jgi:hypothetical protein
MHTPLPAPRLPAPHQPFCGTPYKISTITAVGSLGTPVDLDLFFRHCPLLDSQLPVDPESPSGYLYVEMGSRRAVVPPGGGGGGREQRASLAGVEALGREPLWDGGCGATPPHGEARFHRRRWTTPHKDTPPPTTRHVYGALN